MLHRIEQGWKAYGVAGASLVLALLLTLILEPLQDKRPYLLFFPALMVCAWCGGLPLALGATVLSAVAIHAWVLAPVPLWTVTLLEGIQMGAFIAVAGGMSWALSVLLAAQTRFAVTLESIGDAVIVTDRQGRVTFLNGVAAALTGWMAQEAQGRDLSDVLVIIDMDTRQVIENPVAQVLHARRMVGLANHTLLIARDGTERPIDDSCAPIQTPAGEILGVVLVFRDITERQRAEEAWTRLAAIVESSDDAIIGHSLEGIITSWNQGAERLYGYTEADMVGQSLARLLPSDMADELPSILARLQQGERIAHYETQRLTRDGSRRDVALTISPIQNRAGRLVGASKIARDITAQKQTTAELERQRQETALLAELAQDLSASLDPETVLQRIIAGAQELCGSERVLIALRDPGSDVLITRYEIGAPYMAYEGMRIEPGQGLGGQVLRTGQPWRTEHYATDPRFSKAYLAGARMGGHLAVLAVPILMDGQVEGVLYASNPTARPFTERHEAILVRLAAHAAIALQNAQLYRLAQTELAERRTAEAALARAAAELEQRVEERTAALQREMAERQRLEQEAQRGRHFALLGQLAAGVSHEIRNPLGAVFLHVDLLEEELRDQAPESAELVADTLTEIRTQLARLEDLVQDYLSLVRVSQITRTLQDLGVALRAWAAEWQALATDSGIVCRLDGLEDLGFVAMHANTLCRALLNLVQNALEAMEPEGTLTVTGHRTATHVELQVRDTGSGIPAEQQVRIFEPLYTTKPGGTGLGLYIVQEIITAHEGQVTVESVPGQGSTFTVTLPRAAATAPPVRVAP